MPKKSLIIFGSSRGDGNTKLVVDYLRQNISSDFIDLSDYDFSEFDYEYKNAADDFIRLASQMMNYENIIFASPVYWYSMSAIMKKYFDRLSDIVRYRKEIGRAMAGKKLFALACSSDKEEYEGYFMPFENTAGYLDMQFGGSVHTWVDPDGMTDDVKNRIENFAKKINV